MTRYVANDTNLAREGALAGSNALASDAIYRTDTAAKTGGGQAVVTGPYTGAATTDIDIEIVDNAGSTPQVSAPAFSGVGNGALSDLAVAGIAAQVITITLEDLGTETRKAYAPFQGVTLRAKTAPGNGITIGIDQSGLVLSDTDFALQEDVSPGTNEYEGTHWDISALGEMTLTPDGNIPTTAPRIVFGADPQVYLAFRQYKAGRYVYGFSPAPVRVAVRGTRIHQVTGTRTLTVSDGITPEVFTGCGSLYQTLLAIRDGSALIEVEGLVVNDRLPGGQATVDLSVWTSSYVIGVDPDGSYACLKADLLVTPSTTAPTELLRIQCINADATGQEVWRVEGDVSGRLANATTFQAFADGPYTFTIPLPEIPAGTPGNTAGNIAFEFAPLPGERSLPNVKAHKPRLGAAAKNGRYEFTWTPRPPEDCTEEGAVSGSPREECLGINPPGDETVSDASRIIRLQRITAAVRLHVGANTAPGGEVSDFDVTVINRGSNIAGDILKRMQAGTLDYPAWAGSTAYAIDVVIQNAGYRYAASVAGTTGASAPSWNTTLGATFSDGTVTWKNIGTVPYSMFDAFLDALINEWAMFAAPSKIEAEEWTLDQRTILGAYLKPSTENGCIYRAASSNDVVTGVADLDYATHGGVEPTWPTEVNGSPADRWVKVNDVAGLATRWVLAYRYWSPLVPMALGAIARPGNGHVYRITTAGITDGTVPTWPTTAGATVNDGTAVWTEIPARDFAIAPTDQFYQRYVTAGNDILAAAGLDPNFDDAGTDGDGCWQDPGDDGYWQSTDGYLPAFNNLYWHTSRQFIDDEGNPYNQSTREFGLGFQVGCPNLLQYGDKAYVIISDVAGASTGQGYQEGDTFNVIVQNAVPVPFGGGQTGDDTQTWAVALSIDGRIDDYSLVTTALAPYAYSDAGASLGFQITPGGIPFALGDKFVAEIEGGRFKWRRDGGAWSGNLDIDMTALADGLSVQFNAGIAPSWAAGDRWTYRAEATYGAVQMRTPLDGEMEWSGSTVIALAGGPINGIGIYRHRIPSDATITLQGSNDDFSTTPLSVTIPWRRDNLWYGVVANYAKYRISINKSGAIRWLYAGPGTQLQLKTGSAELGRMVKLKRLTTAIAPGGLGATVSHEGLPKATTDAFENTLSHALEFNDGLLGVVPNDTEPDTGFVRYESDTIEIEELQGFQPSDSTKLLQSISLTLRAA